MRCKKSIHEGESLINVIKISQSHSTNILKGAFPNMSKNRLGKDKKYKQGEKAGENGKLFTLEYCTNKHYETKIGIEELPGTKFFLDDPIFNKFFTFLHYQFNKNGYCRFNSKEFLDFIGKEPTPDRLKKLNSKLDSMCWLTLPCIKLRFRIGEKESKTIVPFPATGVSRGIVDITFEESYAKSIKGSYYHLPYDVGKLSKNAYLIADYIYSYARAAKKNEFSLTMETLYKKSGLPLYEGVKDRNTNRAIKEPIYKCLQEIKETIGVPDKYLENGTAVPIYEVAYKLIIKEDELNSENWENFLASKIHIKIVGYDQICKGLQSRCRKFRRIKKGKYGKR